MSLSAAITVFAMVAASSVMAAEEGVTTSTQQLLPSNSNNTSHKADKTAGKVVGSIFIGFAILSMLLVVWYGFKKGSSSEHSGAASATVQQDLERAELRSNPAGAAKTGYGAA